MAKEDKRPLPPTWLLRKGAISDGNPTNGEYSFLIRNPNTEFGTNGLRIIVESKSGYVFLEEYTPTAKTVAVVPLSDRPLGLFELSQLVKNLQTANAPKFQKFTKNN